MHTKKGVIMVHTLSDLHNSSDDGKAKLFYCVIPENLHMPSTDGSFD